MVKKNSEKKLLAEYADSSRLMGFGLYFAVAVLLFTAIGWWIDQYLNSLPLFTIVGLFAGAGGGFYRLYTLLMATNEKENKECGKG